MKKIDREPQIKLSELIGTPKRGIIFSDLDGVWFDEGNNFASPVKSDISITQEARDAGFLLVLTSDTGALALPTFAKELNFDPVVIAENGALVYLPNQGTATYLTQLGPFFATFREEAKSALLNEQPGSYVFVGDATRAIKSDTLRLPANRPVFLINGARIGSFGVYTRVTDSNGKLTINDEQTKKTEEIVNQLLKGRESGAVSKTYPQLGSSLVKDPTVAKWKAIKWVIDQFSPSLDYYMIGDSTNDSMKPISDRITVCAVGNANDELKDEAIDSEGIVAPNNLIIAQGANYIIREILKKE